MHGVFLLIYWTLTRHQIKVPGTGKLSFIWYRSNTAIYKPHRCRKPLPSPFV